MKKAFTIFILLLFLTTTIAGYSKPSTYDETNPITFNPRGNILYVGGSGSNNYTKIQDAIDNASNGDMVFVYDDSSPYYENIEINKSINLIGEDKNTTIIGGSNSGDAVMISDEADWVNISGFTIQNIGGGDGVRINSKHNTISGNTISNNSDGIRINSKYNTISGNTISNNEYGISSSNSNNTILNNIISSNKQSGIYLWSSNNKIMVGNNISNNDYGIRASDSSNNAISENTISSNSWCGIALSSSSDDNLIYNNNIMGKTIISNSEYGIFLSHSSDNNILGNNISNNDYGIRVSASSNNAISENTINSNSWRGITLSYSSGNNLIYNNYFNNNNNVYDYGNNIWNITKTSGTNIIGGSYLGGNYWSDYTGNDTNGDGIGDTNLPYNSSGNIHNGGDWLPLYIDTNPPEIVDNTPAHGYTGDAFTFNATITDPGGVSTIWVEYWYGSGSHTNDSMTNTANNYWEKTITINDTLETLHYIISANDTSDNWNNTGTKDVTVTDDDKPEITNIQASPSSQLPNGSVNISCDVTDNIGVNTVKVNITLPNGTTRNVTMNEGSYYYNSTYTQLGTYYYFIWTNDTNSNSNTSSTYNFIIGTPPNVPSSPSPSDDSTGVSTTTDLSWIGGDPDGDEVTYDVYFGTTSPPPVVESNQLDTTYDPGTLDYNRKYYWKIVAWDSHGTNATGAIWSFTTKSKGSGGPGPGPPGPNEKPIADGSGPYSGFVDVPITFDGSGSYDSDGTITNYIWDFGDGTIGYEVNPTHEYTEIGNYTIALTVTDNGGKTDTDTTYAAIIGKPNHPPNEPELNGTTIGHKNTDYNYTAKSTDADNDDIQYVIDWGDGETTTTEFVPNGTATTQTHNWTAAGEYIIKVKAYDNQTESGTTEITVLIDAHYVKDIGYFIDNDSDGTYDAFHSNKTGEKTDVGTDDGKYLIDSDGDGEWDRVYNLETGELIEYEAEPTLLEEEEDYTSVLILVIVMMITLIVCVVLIKIEKDKEKKQPKKKTSKKTKK